MWWVLVWCTAQTSVQVGCTVWAAVVMQEWCVLAVERHTCVCDVACVAA